MKAYKGTCTCGHVRYEHKEYATTYRTNGPKSNSACAICDCWKYKPEGHKHDFDARGDCQCGAGREMYPKYEETISRLENFSDRGADEQDIERAENEGMTSG